MRIVTAATHGTLAGEERELQALRDHPFLSRRQLELCLRRPLRTIRYHLQCLRERGLVQQHNARQPWMYARSLYSLTPNGVEQVAKLADRTAPDVSRQMSLDRPRLEQLLVMMERVFQVRTFLLWLQQNKPHWEWSMPFWDVEVDKLFGVGDKSFKVPFHGAAIMVRPNGRWSHVVVELDLRRVPIEKDRDRLIKFVMAQSDPRFVKTDNREEFPILVLIAQDEFRLQDYYAVLRATAMARQLPLPRAYLTTISQMNALPEDPTIPIWHSTISGERRPLLYDTLGSTGPLPTQPPWNRVSMDWRNRGKDDGGLIPELLGSLVQGRDAKVDPEKFKGSPAAIALILKPLEKRVLDEIASHPLLTSEEMALLLHLSPGRVNLATRKLVSMELAKEHSVAETEAEHTEASPSAAGTAQQKRYLLTEHGIRYLALIAGFQNNVRRYVRARGWGDGFDTLLLHWQHTQAENQFFLGLARIAQREQHELVWLSELESRLYYDYGNEYAVRVPRRRPRPNATATRPANDASRKKKTWRRSFLPDGRGTYIADGKRFEFTLEIDRSRMPMAKFRRKLTEYYACVASNILRGRGVELLRLLIVTSSWERVETLRQNAVELQRTLKSEAMVPILITTFDRLDASAADQAIWLHVGAAQPGESALTMAKTYCFDCFVPQSKPPREPGRTTYQS